MRGMLIYLALLTTLFANETALENGVSVERFSGLWYEVARTYNEFEEGCYAPTVEYKREESMRYRVFNRCFKGDIDGEKVLYTGRAKSLDGKSMSQMAITYYYIFTKEYRVLHIEPDYSAAIVADESLEQVWLMSRTPNMDEQLLKKMLAQLSMRMDITRLIYPKQDPKGRYQ